MYSFGARSLQQLEGVNHMLAETCHLAIKRTPIDFGVYEGMRTLEKQREYVAAGVSWTINSKHLTGDAVDLIPYIDGAYRWEWQPIFTIGEVYRECWIELWGYDQAALRWGGAWMNVLTVRNRALSLEQLQKRYIQSRYAANRPARPDGAHWEIGF